MREKYLLLLCTLTSLAVQAQNTRLPIKPARTIEFNTDEGSYMDIDVSPNGEKLIFEMLGDLYTLPVTGGKARQLTRGMALNLRPSWSPDGKTIGCFSDASGIFRITAVDTTGKTLMSLPGEAYVS